MILVTVGMQLGFDRLIAAMDALAPALDQRIVAQTGPGEYVPRAMEAHRSIAPEQFDALVCEARLIVAHAGIGSVLTAKRLGKPIVLVPRRAALGEHRNDHQLATIGQLAGRQGIFVVREVSELPAAISEALAFEPLLGEESPGSDRLKAYVRAFIAGASR